MIDCLFLDLFADFGIGFGNGQIVVVVAVAEVLVAVPAVIGIYRNCGHSPPSSCRFFPFRLTS